MISIKLEQKPDKDWNNRLLSSGMGNHNQTMERGTHFERNGQIPYYLKFIGSDEEIVGQLLLAKSSRFDNKGRKRSILKKIPKLKQNLYFWIYGPIIFDPSASFGIYSALGKFLLEEKCKVFGSTNPQVHNEFSALGKKFKLEEWSTYIIDLKQSKQDIYKNIEKHSGRKNIERSEKKGVIVEEIDDDSLFEYCKLREEGKSISIEEKYQQYLKWWRLTKPLGRSGFLAKWKGEVVGGLLFYFFNNTIIEGGVARSETERKNNLYSQDLIKWKIIEWGIKNKMKCYDLSGYNPNPKTKKEEGIKRYKAKWGGKKFSYWFIKK